MEAQASEDKEILLTCFNGITDPRGSNARHPLQSVLFIALCAVISGAESWDDMELYALSKKEWLLAMLPLPHGLPSDDTYRRVLSALSPTSFETAFQRWVKSIVSCLAGDIIPIDGKQIRGAFRCGAENVIHQVSAWSCAHQLVLGQVKTNDKSNEITAIPELLKLLDIKGATITIDAMGTQKAIAQQIIEQKGDYLLALKGNHEALHASVKDYFNHLTTPVGQRLRPPADFYESVDKGHGRLEQRRCWVVQSLDWLEQRESWQGLCSLIKLESSREILSTGQRSTEVRYYISSLNESAQVIEHKIRRHWEIENKLHWTLDVSFGEDASSIHDENAAQNFSLLRKIAMALLRQDTSKGSIKGKRKKAGWDNDFLLQVIFQANFK
jgi:predicted transposase YbfD/YdcC